MENLTIAQLQVRIDKLELDMKNLRSPGGRLAFYDFAVNDRLHHELVKYILRIEYLRYRY